jgi:hypothetical protein
MQLPLRRDDLIVRTMDDETLVYDRARHKAHCLNRAAALVWRHCDGKTTVAEVAKLLPAELGLPADEELVQLALAELRKARLVQTEDAPAVRYSRRDLARKLGVAMVAVPAVLTILAPSVAMAASTIDQHECRTPADVGKCCLVGGGKNPNRRLCVPVGSTFNCNGPSC